MTARRPPAIATWIWKHFGCGPNQEAVLGDLAEEYLRKGSRMWYWRQVLKAVPVSVFKEVRSHKRIAARAMLIGWAIWTIFAVMNNPLFFASFFGGNMAGVEIQPRHPVGIWAFLVWVQVALPFLIKMLIGWIVARVDVGIDPTKSLGPKLIVRFHRDLVLLFAASVLLLNILVVGLLLSVADARGYPLIRPLAANAAVSVFAVLLGGSLRRSKNEESSVD